MKNDMKYSGLNICMKRLSLNKSAIITFSILIRSYKRSVIFFSINIVWILQMLNAYRARLNSNILRHTIKLLVYDYLFTCCIYQLFCIMSFCMCVQGYCKKPLPHNSATRLSFAQLSHIYDDRLYYDIYIETIIDNWHYRNEDNSGTDVAVK